jgi:ribosome-binding protein aMBF1 (putative translation factor)
MKRDEFEDLFAARTDADQIMEDTLLFGFRFLSIIDRHMEEKGITKKALAEKIGASPSYITQLFRGQVRVNLEFISKVEKALEIRFSVALATEASRFEGISLKDFEKMLPESAGKLYAWDENLESTQDEPIAA